MTVSLDELSDLPGFELVERGISDLSDGRETAEALLVAIGAPRLRLLGFELPPIQLDDPEERLYVLLERDGSDSTHARYNALVRRLVSFERAVGCVAR